MIVYAFLNFESSIPYISVPFHYPHLFKHKLYTQTEQATHFSFCAANSVYLVAQECVTVMQRAVMMSACYLLSKSE